MGRRREQRRAVPCGAAAGPPQAPTHTQGAHAPARGVPLREAVRKCLGAGKLRRSGRRRRRGDAPRRVARGAARSRAPGSSPRVVAAAEAARAAALAPTSARVAGRSAAGGSRGGRAEARHFPGEAPSPRWMRRARLRRSEASRRPSDRQRPATGEADRSSSRRYGTAPLAIRPKGARRRGPPRWAADRGGSRWAREVGEGHGWSSGGWGSRRGVAPSRRGRPGWR
mmetsp:Transcript_1079/g.3037  ORF Transcript_1079/g.3037 Transcript_1079/m.3037 type:complete len:226 (-) Transcript_1079:242-919(-)